MASKRNLRPGSRPASAGLGLLRDETASIVVVAATATVTLSVTGTNKTDVLTVSGLTVQPTAGTPLSTGNITSSGTATIAGVAGANFGTLTETPGAATQLGVTTQPAGA